MADLASSECLLKFFKVHILATYSPAERVMGGFFSYFLFISKFVNIFGLMCFVYGARIKDDMKTLVCLFSVCRSWAFMVSSRFLYLVCFPFSFCLCFSSRFLSPSTVSLSPLSLSLWLSFSFLFPPSLPLSIMSLFVFLFSLVCYYLSVPPFSPSLSLILFVIISPSLFPISLLPFQSVSFSVSFCLLLSLPPPW